jgi:hypothetical protein
MPADHFRHTDSKYTKTKKEHWYQRIASEILMRETIEIDASPYSSYQQRQYR